MGALFKRVGVAVVALDLLVGGAATAALHRHAGSPGAKLNAGRLEQIVARSLSAPHRNTSCTADPKDGWDYYCVSSDGSRTLYDVSADRVTQRSDLPSYR